MDEIKLSEHDLQMLLMNYLQAKGWYVMRLNSGRFMVGEGQSKRFILGQRAGTPDIMAFRKDKDGLKNRYVDLIFIEVKVPGNKVTFAQEQVMKELSEKGARCLVIHSLDELEAGLAKLSQL